MKRAVRVWRHNQKNNQQKKDNTMKNINKAQILNAINSESDIVIDDGDLHLVISAYKIAPRYARAAGEFQLAIMGDDAVEINGEAVVYDDEDYDIRATELTDEHVAEINDWVEHFRSLAIIAGLGVSSAEAEVIKDIYNYLFGDQWTLDSVDNDWRNDYLGTHTWGGRDWVYYFDGVNECGIWVDSGEHLTAEEIEKYL